jgi:ATP/maltotriose-dependent transcriptional regulator MalT
VETAAWSVAADAPAAAAVRDGVVSRPGLFLRLTRAHRVVQVSAPPGSGKTVLLRSWIASSGLADCTAWVSVQVEERDPQRLWISVTDALRDTATGSALVRGLTAAPDLDGWTAVERLLEDLASMRERVWLVIDDLHELCSAEALRQLELLIMRAPPRLRFILVTRHDLRLGLHRLRLAGELTEIRTADLRFSQAEARALLDAAGVPVSDSSLALLCDRTEGWAAGLRLAALSLAGHPDPQRFAAEFGGSERTVAEYLLAEVLERQSEEARRLLLRTSILARVNGELADLLTGGSGGERVLQRLEEAGAFVVSLDARRSWFRYHQLFADLLQLELRGSAPAELPALHDAAAGWYAEHGYPVEAVRHAQAAQDWGLAARVLSDHWIGLGLGATAHELLARFPADVIAADAELAARMAGDLEVTGLAYWAQLVSWRSFPLGAERSLQAIELANQHGWADEPIAGVAYLALGVAMVAQGRIEEAERALGRAERTVRTEVEPAAGMRLHGGRGMLEFATGRHDAALSAFRAAERLAGSLVSPHTLAPRLRSQLLQTLVRSGETRRVEQALADMDGPERERGEIRIAEASLRLAQDDPKAAAAVLAPVVDGSAPLQNAHLWEVQAPLLQAIACDALGDAGAARRALERALDRAEPERLLFPFLCDPAPDLLDRHRRLGTAHAGLIAEILNALAGGQPGAEPAGPQRLREPFSHAEARVLRYLPTKLSAPEIADELYLSVNTVKTHMRHVYDKLGVHRRHAAVEQARALGLLASSARRP